MFVTCTSKVPSETKLPEKLFKDIPVIADVDKIKSGCYVIRNLSLHRRKKEDGEFFYFIPKRVRTTDGSLSPEVLRKNALLDTCPPDADKVARPMITMEKEGKVEVRVFDLLQVFETEKEAKDFAKRNYIKDVVFDEHR